MGSDAAVGAGRSTPPADLTKVYMRRKSHAEAGFHLFNFGHELQHLSAHALLLRFGRRRLLGLLHGGRGGHRDSGARRACHRHIVVRVRLVRRAVLRVGGRHERRLVPLDLRLHLRQQRIFAVIRRLQRLELVQLRLQLSRVRPPRCRLLPPKGSQAARRRARLSGRPGGDAGGNVGGVGRRRRGGGGGAGGPTGAELDDADLGRRQALLHVLVGADEGVASAGDEHVVVGDAADVGELLAQGVVHVLDLPAGLVPLQLACKHRLHGLNSLERGTDRHREARHGVAPVASVHAVFEDLHCPVASPGCLGGRTRDRGAGPCRRGGWPRGLRGARHGRRSVAHRVDVRLPRLHPRKRLAVGNEGIAPRRDKVVPVLDLRNVGHLQTFLRVQDFDAALQLVPTELTRGRVEHRLQRFVHLAHDEGLVGHGVDRRPVLPVLPQPHRLRRGDHRKARRGGAGGGTGTLLRDLRKAVAGRRRLLRTAGARRSLRPRQLSRLAEQPVVGLAVEVHLAVDRPIVLSVGRRQLQPHPVPLSKLHRPRELHDNGGRLPVQRDQQPLSHLHRLGLFRLLRLRKRRRLRPVPRRRGRRRPLFRLLLRCSGFDAHARGSVAGCCGCVGRRVFCRGRWGGARRTTRLQSSNAGYLLLRNLLLGRRRELKTGKREESRFSVGEPDVDAALRLGQHGVRLCNRAALAAVQLLRAVCRALVRGGGTDSLHVLRHPDVHAFSKLHVPNGQRLRRGTGTREQRRNRHQVGGRLGLARRRRRVGSDGPRGDSPRGGAVLQHACPGHFEGVALAQRGVVDGVDLLLPEVAAFPQPLQLLLHLEHPQPGHRCSVPNEVQIL
eukprot:Rhum_TRINITY_DN2916_c0_g1::Rhum_TRINITY_DN2916_c0_g1_i1::g.8911::m.8911